VCLCVCLGTVLLSVKDTFQHRKDKLYERQFDVVTGMTVERFARGNEFGLKGRHGLTRHISNMTTSLLSLVEHFILSSHKQVRLSNAGCSQVYAALLLASSGLSYVIRVATNLENLEYSGISLNVENSANSQGIMCNLREKL